MEDMPLPCTLMTFPEHMPVKLKGALLTLQQPVIRVPGMVVNDGLSAALPGWEMDTTVMSIHQYWMLFRLSNRQSIDRRDGYPSREELPLPTEPPYTAHIGNMSFDTTEGEVSDFFKDCQVTKVRIVEDKLDRKPKGFGYVEFATLDGLKKALSFAGSSLAGRTIRVSVADPRECIPQCMGLIIIYETY